MTITDDINHSKMNYHLMSRHVLIQSSDFTNKKWLHDFNFESGLTTLNLGGTIFRELQPSFSNIKNLTVPFAASIHCRKKVATFVSGGGRTPKFTRSISEFSKLHLAIRGVGFEPFGMIFIPLDAENPTLRGGSRGPGVRRDRLGPVEAR